jgi:hypothetical protein
LVAQWGGQFCLFPHHVPEGPNGFSGIFRKDGPMKVLDSRQTKALLDSSHMSAKEMASRCDSMAEGISLFLEHAPSDHLSQQVARSYQTVYDMLMKMRIFISLRNYPELDPNDSNTMAVMETAVEEYEKMFPPGNN